jgi:Tol biopolymer transport system component
LSPDETSVIVAVTDAITAQPDLWLVSLARGTTSRVTSDQSTDWFPAWSPDGSHLFFASARNGSAALFQKTGVSSETAVAFDAAAAVATYPLDVSRDGKSLLYMQSTSRGYDVGVLPLSGDQKATPYLASRFNEVQARFSPNNRWVAFASDESGRFEVQAHRRNSRSRSAIPMPA